MRGLVSYGPTCYLNAALQGLALVEPITRFLAENPYTGSCGITLEYQKLIAKMGEADEDPVHTRSFFQALSAKFPKFRFGSQCDCSEVIIELIDVLEKSLGKQIVKPIFNGIVMQTVTYLGGVAASTSSFCVFVLEPLEPCTLNDLIKAFEKPEIIDDYADPDGVTRHDQACIARFVSEWPRVICFVFSQFRRVRHKISLPLVFEGRDLFCVIMHFGDEYSGHYAAVCKDASGVWYTVDDKRVEVMQGAVFEGNYYLAMYQ